MLGGGALLNKRVHFRDQGGAKIADVVIVDSKKPTNRMMSAYPPQGGDTGGIGDPHSSGKGSNGGLEKGKDKSSFSCSCAIF
jgi:hypothetical protein